MKQRKEATCLKELEVNFVLLHHLKNVSKSKPHCGNFFSATKYKAVGGFWYGSVYGRALNETL